MDARQCTNCNTINAPTSQFCSVCGQPLSDEAEIGIEQLKRDIEATPEYKRIMQMIRENLMSVA
jgi:rRNA maturation endonuclease Nob1